MQSIAYAASKGAFSAFPQLFPHAKTYAKHPVWQGSAQLPVKWHRIDRKQRNVIWQEAVNISRGRDRVCKTGGGRKGGVVEARRTNLDGNALSVLRALLFDFLNMRTGQLDPSYEGLAKKTGLSRATVARALVRLRELRIIHWVRRCHASVQDGKYVVEQERNAYAVLPPTGWRGFVARVAHKVMPHEWSPAPVMPTILEQAAEARQQGGWEAERRVLLSDTSDKLMATLARLGDAVHRRQS